MKITKVTIPHNPQSIMLRRLVNCGTSTVAMRLGYWQSQETMDAAVAAQKREGDPELSEGSLRNPNAVSVHLIEPNFEVQFHYADGDHVLVPVPGFRRPLWGYWVFLFTEDSDQKEVAAWTAGANYQNGTVETLEV